MLQGLACLAVKYTHDAYDVKPTLGYLGDRVRAFLFFLAELGGGTFVLPLFEGMPEALIALSQSIAYSVGHHSGGQLNPAVTLSPLPKFTFQGLCLGCGSWGFRGLGCRA